MGLKNPDRDPHQYVGWWQYEHHWSSKDFHLTSIHEAYSTFSNEIWAIGLQYGDGKSPGRQEQSTLARIETLYKQTNPGFAF